MVKCLISKTTITNINSVNVCIKYSIATKTEVKTKFSSNYALKKN